MVGAEHTRRRCQVSSRARQFFTLAGNLLRYGDVDRVSWTFSLGRRSMRCPACNHIINDETKCPACQHEINNDNASRNGAHRARGEFRGRMSNAKSGRATSSRVGAFISPLLALLADPRASITSKAILVLAVLYIVMPLDFLPGGLIPVIGWLDDIIVGLLSWNYLKPDIERYKKT